MQQIHIRLDRRDLAIVKRFARDDRCTVTEVVRRALRLLHAAEALREQEARRAASVREAEA